LADIARYCSVTQPEGVLFMASTRPNQLTDLEQVSTEDVVHLVEQERGHFDWVINDLAPTTHSPTNLGALEVTDALVIVTTPAKDSLGKAMKSIAWLHQNGYERLALDVTVVVNRAHWWTNTEKIHNEFIDALGPEFSNITVFPVNQSWHLTGGRVIHMSKLNRKVKAQVDQVIGHHSTVLADAFVDDTEQLTHLEEMATLATPNTSEGGENNG
jgi:MinD-like ATPase involved in chromosome partitioning or flagellar assembly